MKIVLCLILKKISTMFTKKYSECKDCNIKRGVKRYYDNKDKFLFQQRL